MSRSPLRNRPLTAGAASAPAASSGPPPMPPSLRRPRPMSTGRLGQRMQANPWQVAQEKYQMQTPQMQAIEDNTLRRFHAKKLHLEEHYLDGDTSPRSFDGAEGGVISDFLGLCADEAETHRLCGDTPSTPRYLERDQFSPDELRQQAFREAVTPQRSLLSSRGSERLAREVRELKEKCLRLERDKNKVQEKLTQSEKKVEDLQDDIKKMRSDPQTLHPAVQRLRKMGLNTPALAELGERWAGYVLGRSSMAMEVGSYAFRSVFSTHARNGVLTEESFKSVLRQFEPTIKSDQLTRLWFFADSDGSGQLDLFEFLRMFGCNANGDMSDEYFEAVTMHMHRKFQAKGGIRRVYAAADKDMDMQLSTQEWTNFLSTCKLGLSRQDMNLTRQEMNQVFIRMNTSNTGNLTVMEFETGLEAAAAKSHVSEKWVRDTFKATAVAIQEEGLHLQHLISGTISVKDFRDLLQRFVPRLRLTQIDRLWKYVINQHAEAGGTLVTGDQAVKGGPVRATLDAQAFMRIAFGNCLGNEELSDMVENKNSEGHVTKSHNSAGGTGREVLEQLAALLRQHVGEVSAEEVFDCLDPFLTPEHFHQQLVSKFGLQYDSLKTKQIFSLIDIDRDGKISRYEFLSMFRKLMQMTRKDEEGDEDEGPQLLTDERNCRMQVNRLLNRILVLESDPGRPAARGNVYGSDEVVPMVPERQYTMLSASHQKVKLQLAKLRGGMDFGLPSKELSRQQDCLEPDGDLKHSSTLRRCQTSAAISAGEPIPDGGECAEQHLCFRELPRLLEGGQRERARSVSSPTSESKMEKTDSIQALQQEVHSLRQENSGLARDFAARMEAHHADCEALQERLAGTEKALASAIQDADFSRQCSSSSLVVPMVPREPSGSPSPGPRLSVQSLLSEMMPRQISEDAQTRRSSTVARKSMAFQTGASSVCSTGPRRRSSAIKFSAEVDKVVPPQTVAPALRALRQLAESASHSVKDKADALNKSLVGTVVQDRFRVDTIVSFSAKIVVVRSMDLLLNRPATLKLLYDMQMTHRMSFAYEHCILSILASVPHIPDVYHFSGSNDSLVFCALECLQGQTLAVRFKEVQTQAQADDMSFLEATEIADALLRGIDQCHQLNIVNLGIRPDTIWISPPLSGARVRILNWEHAQGSNGKTINAEFDQLLKTKEENKAKAPPHLFRGTTETDFSSKRRLLARSKTRLSANMNAQVNHCLVQCPDGDQPFPNVFVKDVGALYYMPTEQLYNMIASHEADGLPHDSYTWYHEKFGPAAKIDEQVVHWWQKGVGLVETAEAVPMTALGRVFEVEVFKIMTMVRRQTDDLGFSIGFTTLPPGQFFRDFGALDSAQFRQKAVKECFFAGGDCAYHIRGEVKPAARNSQEVLDNYSNEIAADECTLHLREGLRMGDRVCLVAEWSGSLSLFINGEVVGRCAHALRPGEAVRPLYGVVDLHAHSDTNEHNVRAVSLIPEAQMLGQSLERASAKAAELRSMQEMVYASLETPLGPAVDVYACALVILQCFRGGRSVTLSPAFNIFQNAMVTWISDCCPYLQGEYYLLSAIRDLMSQTETTLADITSPGLRTVLSRGLKRSRFARLNSCWEFALMLNEVTGWQEMTFEFLSSHVQAADQAERRHAAELHLLNTRNLKQESAVVRSQSGKLKSSSKQPPLSNTISSLIRGESFRSHEEYDVDDQPGQVGACSAYSEGAAQGPSPTSCAWRSQGSPQRRASSPGLRSSPRGLSPPTSPQRALSREPCPKARIRPSSPRKSPQPNIASQTLTAQSPGPVVAFWDLRPFVLGHSHLTRAVQVLTTWSRRKAIRIVAVTRFGEQIPEQLQEAFVNCFNASWRHETEAQSCMNTQMAGAIRPQKAARQQLVRKVVSTASLADDPDRKPALVLEDILLPTSELPSDRFPLRELMQRHLLWLAAHFVARLDLDPGTEIFDGKVTRVGDSEEVVAELATAVSRSQVLEHLVLRSSNLGERGGLVLATAIRSCPPLRWLNLADNDLGPKAAQAIVQAVAEVNNLTYLDLSRNNIGDKGTEWLSEPLSTCVSLRELRLGQNGIGPDGGEALSKSLLENGGLTSLHLGHNDLNLSATLALLRVTCATVGLSSLDLEHNSAWPPYEGSEGLVQSLVDCLGCSGDSTGKVSCLKALSLRHCNVRSASAEKLFAALVHNSVLERLNMSWNGIRHIGSAEIAQMLAEPCSALQELDLRDNQLGTQDAIGQAFVKFFAKSHQLGSQAVMNSKLRLLNLGNNELTSHGTRLLAQALPAFVALEELFLYHNPQIGVLGAQAITRLLSMSDGLGLPSLQRLVLSVCGLGDAGVKSIAGALRGNDRLTELDISGNSVTDASVQSLGEVIRFNRTLQMLNLSLNCIRHLGLRQLLNSAVARQNSLETPNAHEEVQLIKIDVSAQADPVEMESVNISSEVLEMFVGLTP